MSEPSWTSQIARLVCATSPGLVDGNLVAISSVDASQQSAGFLSRGSGIGEEQRAVRIVPVPQLPTRTVAISEALADDLGLRGDGTRWQLTEQPVARASAMVLESMTEGSLRELADLLAQAPDLSGQVCWLADDGGQAWLQPQGTPFRVRSATGPGGQPLRGLVQVVPETRLDLIAPGNRTGVDIVILADCSGSMSWNDIERRGDFRLGGSSDRYVTRMQALKGALEEMIDIRAHTAGRVSRVALVKFTNEARTVFPANGGMAELNGMNDPHALSEFRQAVGLLQHQDAGTDIGRALHFAAELLYRQGVPDNDRLIVLVSDGADWTQKSDDTTGEAVAAVSDPISLMEELERSLSIRLHAIGISDEGSFFPWWDIHHRRRHGDPHPSIIPNHRLLARLVEVGGGDPRRVGGMEVLQEYFAGLGEGVTRHIGQPARSAPRSMQTALETLTEPVRSEDQTLARRRSDLADRARQLRSACVKLSKRCGAKPFYRKADDDFTDKLMRLGRTVGNEDDFRVWVNDLSQVFEESLESRLREEAPPRPYDIPSVIQIVRDGRLNQIRVLRNDAGHVHLSSKDEQYIGQIYMRFADRKFIDHDDGRRWTQVQVGLLEDLVGVLDEVREAFEKVPSLESKMGLRPGPYIDGWR